MRFLEANNDGGFSLTEDLGGKIPRYAILSHRWEAEEVTFKDLMNDTGKDKAGYKKIRFCGEQAGRDGIQYFWVDTCCIDKTNSTELAEAINSMFCWYRDAAKCYVYLSDVPGSASNTDDNSHLVPWEPAFRESKWFTRGWTLQELLAPTSVEFFSRHNKRLGDKETLKRHIHEITRIPISALEGIPLSRFGVDERFSWAEDRQTTREEDQAYSLLGIFGIYLPLIYGEGRKHAFKRLIKEIQNSLTEPEQYLLDPQSRSCIQDLRTTDPREDKKRIEDTKGGLLRDSYQWVLERPEFHNWRNAKLGQVLWIKGDPGKGKTMLLCGIINEISSATGLEEDKNPTTLLSYFFCQATDTRINNAVAVLRGLIYLLIDQQPLLIKHIRQKYDRDGKALFEDANAWGALSEIFTSILQDPVFTSTYLIIDALDECVEDLPKLLDFIVQRSSISPRVKWIVSSRNWPDIEERLERAGHKVKLCLELNEESISIAVRKYIEHKVCQLADQKKYDYKTREAVRQHLVSNATNTFLWVALVCENLKNLPRWKTLARLNEFPPGLNSLYHRMIRQICNSDEADLCKQILAITSTVYRPITLTEISSFIETLGDMADDYESLAAIIGLCGSLLTVRESTIYFVHQSAKDFLLQMTSDDIFPSSVKDIHYNIFSRSLQVMSKTLERDVYGLRSPGITINEIKQPDSDPLAIAGYSCLYWVDHWLDFDTGENSSNAREAYTSVYSFLCQSYLYWLEALSLMKSLPRGIIMIRKLEGWLQADKSPDLFTFIYDAKRFALYNRSVIEQAPLQLYCSALVFSPETSVVRNLFDKYIPSWIQRKPKVQTHWSATLQTLEGHSDLVKSAAFSPDSKQVVSGSSDKTVQLWDATTGALLQTLKGHLGWVNSVAFSPDGKQIVSGSGDKTVRLWDAKIGKQLYTLEGHLERIVSVAFSPDGKQLVSGSSDKTVRLWDATTGALLQTLEGHSDLVNSVAFSSDGKQVVSGSSDQTVRLWDATIGAQLQTFKGFLSHSDRVNSVAFSPNGKQLVSGSNDKTVRLWDATTGALLHKLEGHFSSVSSVAFSPNSKQVISGSHDKIVRLWDATTGALLKTLKGHSNIVTSVAFSPDSKLVVSGSDDTTVRLWNAIIRPKLQIFKDYSNHSNHSGQVNSIAVSPDGKQVVSGSSDKKVRLWDATTGAPLHTLKGHSNGVNYVAFSPDGKQVVSGSRLEVLLWDATIGALLHTLQGHPDTVNFVAFSPNGTQVITGSYSKIMLWDVTTGALLQKLDGRLNDVSYFAFSPDSKQVPTLHVRNDWLVDGNTNVLWLPIDYRPTCKAIRDGYVIFGHSSGRMSFFQIKEGPKLILKNL